MQVAAARAAAEEEAEAEEEAAAEAEQAAAAGDGSAEATVDDRERGLEGAAADEALSFSLVPPRSSPDPAHSVALLNRKHRMLLQSDGTPHSSVGSVPPFRQMQG